MKATQARTPCGVPRAKEILDKPSDMAVYKAVARREIPHRRVGRKIIFFEEELVAFLEQQPGVTLDEALETTSSR